MNEDSYHRLDELDLDIVRILSRNGRASYSEISKDVGVSVGTVRNRINHMRETGVLYLNVWVDPYRSGLGIYATLLLKVRAGQLQSVASALAALDETGYVATLVGGHDILVDVFCRDVPYLSHFINNEIQAIDGVLSVTSYLVTEIKFESSLNIGKAINKWKNSDGADREGT